MQGQRIVFPAPGEAQVEVFQVDEPPPGHVLLLAEASVISPGTEGAAFTGRQNMNTMTYPQRPGYAWVGKVIQVGAEAGGAKLGDRVLVMKPHASHATVCPTTEVYTPVPDGVLSEEAALARLIAVGATTLQTTSTRPGDWVAVVGLGVVGLCAALLFRAAGYRVVGLDVVPNRCERARQLGLSDTFTSDVAGVVEAVRARTADGCHLVIDASGHVQGELLAIRIARRGGEVVMLGAPWTGGAAEPIGDLFQQIFLRYLHIRSGWEWSVPHLPSPYTRGSIQENLTLGLHLIAEGKIPARELLTEVVRPDEAQRVYRALTEQRDRCLTFAFRWT